MVAIAIHGGLQHWRSARCWCNRESQAGEGPAQQPGPGAGGQAMSLYAVARVMQLSSGMYLAKSQEFPGCEGQSFAQKEAVAHFEEAVTRRITEMFGAGQM